LLYQNNAPTGLLMLPCPTPNDPGSHPTKWHSKHSMILKKQEKQWLDLIGKKFHVRGWLYGVKSQIFFSRSFLFIFDIVITKLEKFLKTPL